LGHRVSAEGVAPLKKKVDALLEHPQPQTVQDLQAFLGTVNFYRRFLPAAASLLQPLTDALSGEAKAKDRVPWLPRWRPPSPVSRRPSPAPASSPTPPPVRRSASWWTPPRTTWERPYSCGPHPLQAGSRFSQRSSIPCSSNTGLHSWDPVGTSGTCVMDVSSLYSPTTSPSLSPWPGLRTPGCRGRAATCPT
jgi:hypothetical protein